jgi:methyl-accepting chemotaxis protein
VSRFGQLPVGRIQAMPGDALRALRTLPEIVATMREIAAHTARLTDVANALDRVSADTRQLPAMREDIASIAAAMPVLIEVQRHLEQLPETIGRLDEHIDRLDEGIDRLSALMEKILVAVDGLDSTVETLRAAVEPMGRLAGRIPGQRKPE